MGIRTCSLAVMRMGVDRMKNSMPGSLNRENIMSAHTYKIIELVGSSTEGSDQAIRDAIAKAALSVKHMDWYEVIESRGHIVDGKVAHFQVTIKVGFRLE